MKQICLSELPLNTRAEVVRIDCAKSLKARLNELGLFEGEVISPVLKSPLGEPMAYKIGGALIALRNSDCDKITVEKNDSL